MDLPDFLLARAGDREHQAPDIHRSYCDTFDIARRGGDYLRSDCDCGEPERVLAECAAKQAIVEQYRLTVAEQVLGEPQTVLSLAVVLMHLAAPFAGHPDYRPEWQPPV